ncbi:LacI family DNA-binding transcriptional regulator [Nonomuraea sp. NPDC002799]
MTSEPEKTDQPDVSKPSIRDVAALAGVPELLVPLVMRRAPNVSERHRHAVLKAARELGYQPRELSQHPAEDRTTDTAAAAELHQRAQDQSAAQADYDLEAGLNRLRQWMSEEVDQPDAGEGVTRRSEQYQAADGIGPSAPLDGRRVLLGSRLVAERAVLERVFPDFQFHGPLDQTYVAGAWTSHGGNAYTIRVDIPPGYPDECPNTYITQPSPLQSYSRKSLESYGTSDGMRTFQTDRPGWVKIDIHRPAWSANISLVKVIHGAMLWLTAYEAHLQEGSSISRFLMQG